MAMATKAVLTLVLLLPQTVIMGQLVIASEFSETDTSLKSSNATVSLLDRLKTPRVVN